MGLFDRFSKRKEESTTTEDLPPPQCPHTALVPRWDQLDDMGKEDLVSHYYCEGCSSTFTREEGERIMRELKNNLPMN